MIYLNQDVYSKLKFPSRVELGVGSLICAGSFVFNVVMYYIIGDMGFGQTDYTIFIVGLIVLFFGYTNYKTIYPPVILIGGVRIIIAGLNFIFTKYFLAIASLFVQGPVRILRFFGYPVLAKDNVILVCGLHEKSQLSVGFGCMGLNSLVFFILILIVLIYKYKVALRQKVLCVVIGIIGALAVNLARLVMLCLISYYYGQEITGFIHRNIGDVLFIVWLVIFWWVALKYLLKETPDMFIEDIEE